MTIRTYNLGDVFSGGKPAIGSFQPNFFIIDLEPDVKPITILVGQDKTSAKHAIFFRINLKDTPSNIPPINGQRVITATLDVTSKAINNNVLVVDVGLLKPDGFWSAPQSYKNSIQASGMDCADFKLSDENDITILSTPNYVLDGTRSHPINNVSGAGGAKEYGQCILNNTGSDFSPDFCHFLMHNFGAVGGFMRVRVYNAAKDDGSDDKPILPLLFSSIDFGVGAVGGGLQDVRFVLGLGSSIFPHKNGKRRVYLVNSDFVAIDRYVAIGLNDLSTGGTDNFGSAIMNIPGGAFGAGFHPGTYHTTYDLQHMYNNVDFIGGTPKSTFPPVNWDQPFARTGNVSFPFFPAVDIRHKLDFDGKLAPMIEKWINDSRYPYAVNSGDMELIGFTISTPSPAVNEQEREIASFDITDIQLTLDLVDPIIGCAEFDGVISSAVSLETLLESAVNIESSITQSVSIKTNILPTISMTSKIRQSVSIKTRIC